MSASAACFVLFIAGLSLGTSAISVGDCNMTYFISNGQQCQREMIKNLQSKPNTNCSYEYEGEKSCLRKHIAGCLTNLALFVGPVTSLLLHQAYHCGDVSYQPSSNNNLILKLIKCKSQAFMDTEFCWRYFRDRLNANRSDPLLCREYAVAKECITEKAKANCEMGELLSRDTYNPFCPNNTDPALHTNDKDLENPRLSCKTSSIYRTAADCEEKFLKNFIGDEKPDCGTAYTALRACIDEQLSQTCKDYSNNQRLKGEIEKAALAVFRGRRFFCETVNLRIIDLDFKVRDLVPCKEDFFPAMEKCAKPIRMEYKAGNNTAGELCRKFRTAVDCSNVVQKLHCKFEKYVAIIIQDPYTLFCTSGTEAGRKNASGAVSISAGLCFTIFALVLQLLQEI
ncbi:hypothetical protein OS493_022314 [Desmophyllum pertusum]|uniref:Uncharacterized protein n=1 Tax=Desmophyllum pertusum TaxID=174260 RepID=A0A9W9ZZK7_9CNID|nr:hypothetical protein OS493_022314 [Desmophyllum pertusum]